MKFKDIKHNFDDSNKYYKVTFPSDIWNDVIFKVENINEEGYDVFICKELTYKDYDAFTASMIKGYTVIGRGSVLAAGAVLTEFTKETNPEYFL